MNNKELIQRLLNFDDEEGIDSSTGFNAVSGDVNNIEEDFRTFLEERNAGGYFYERNQNIILTHDNNLTINLEYDNTRDYFDTPAEPMAKFLRKHLKSKVIVPGVSNGFNVKGGSSDISYIFSRIVCDFSQPGSTGFVRRGGFIPGREITAKIKLNMTDTGKLTLSNPNGPMFFTDVMYWPGGFDKTGAIEIDGGVTEVFPAVTINIPFLERGAYDPSVVSRNITLKNLNIGYHSEYSNYTRYATTPNFGTLDIHAHEFYEFQSAQNNMLSVLPTYIELDGCDVETLEIGRVFDIVSLKGLGCVKGNLTLQKSSNGRRGYSDNISDLTTQKKRLAKYNIQDQNKRWKDIIVES